MIILHAYFERQSIVILTKLTNIIIIMRQTAAVIVIAAMIVKFMI